MSSLYLMKRGSTYYFRRAIPANLRSAFSGATEFIHSLHTKDREEAKRLRILIASKTDALLEEARRGIQGGYAIPPKLGNPEEVPLDRCEPKWASAAAKTIDLSEWEDLLRRWTLERKPAAKTVDMHKGNAKTFFAAVPKKLCSIVEADVERFKDDLLRSGQTQANTKCILSRLKTLLAFAKSKKIISTNPAADIKIVVKDSVKREPFDVADLEAIFSRPLFTVKCPTAGSEDCAKFWIPILALCQGARLEEIAQLRLIDVKAKTYYDQDGVKRSWPFLTITRDKLDGLKTKTDSSVRQVPVHPFVIKLGFIDYVNNLRDKGEKWLFPELKAGAYGRRCADFGDWFSDFLRSECCILSRTKVFYSFRHTFKDLTRDSDIPDSIQRQFMGHAKGDVADGYGKGHSDYRLVEAMKSLRIPGITISGLKSYPL